MGDSEVTRPDPALKYVLRDMGAAARDFYARLDAGELATTFCPSCDQHVFPARERCPACSGPVEWRALSGKGNVYAFTQQERGLRFTAPDVVGIAELEEGIRVFGVFDDAYDDLAIGSPIEIHLRRDVAGLTLLAFSLRRMSAIRIRDSLTGEVHELRPRNPGKIGIYACGPTVYARIHVGNARPFVVFALFKRFLEHEGYEVTLVENVTDVNDKIYDAARERGLPSAELAREMTEAYFEDTGRLGLGRPDHEPLASETIDEIIGLIAALVDSGHAYAAEGDVYFSVRSFPDYGKLSNRRLEDLVPQDTGEPDEERQLKRDPIDFALWKAQKEGEDTAWDAPWGRGRPGWHIECSAMAESILGLDFDIHGGGLDLVFPHHENEIAQTEAGRRKPLARLWMHNGMIEFGEEKMAKSVGNIRLLSDALDQFGPDALILYFLSGHYRGPLAFSESALEQAQSSVERIRNFCRLVDRHSEATTGSPNEFVAARGEAFFEALRDDFKTPEALAALFELVAEGNRRLEAGDRLPGGAAALAEMLQVIGLEALLRPEAPVDEQALRLAEQREAARTSGDFARADAIRAELAERGYEVRDTSEGPVLVRIGK